MSGWEGDQASVAVALGERLAAVRQRLAAAGAPPGAVGIVAVTKGFGAGAVRAAADLGLADLAENYAAELLTKARTLSERRQAVAAGPGPSSGLGPGERRLEPGPTPARWHFLGAVQRNKVRALAPAVHLWQSVTRLAEGEQIARWAPGAGVLVQVEVAGRPDRRGVAPGDAERLVDALRTLDLDVRGLMAVAPKAAPEQAESAFGRLARLGRELGLSELSMGMSDDFEAAVRQGATMVRLGRALLGRRPALEKLRE